MSTGKARTRSKNQSQRSARPMKNFLAAGEAALGAGKPKDARQHLNRAIKLGVPESQIPRLALSLAETNRYLGKHKDSLDWIEERLKKHPPVATRAVLLRAKITSLRGIDTKAILDTVDEALEAADSADDLDSYAANLMGAAFAAYRRGDAKAAARFGHLARGKQFKSSEAAINALRAQMFAATVANQLEEAMQFSKRVRDKHIANDNHGNAGNECNNIAEHSLELGRPDKARAEAERAVALASRAGHALVEKYAMVLVAQSIAEQGRRDEGIELLREASVNHTTHALSADSAVVLSFWLVDRNAQGDAQEASTIVEIAINRAIHAGVSHILTALLAILARAQHRLGNNNAARAALADARAAAETADSVAERHLALAIIEILPEPDPSRRVVIHQTRAKLLRNAGQRDDPHAYCTRFCLHRRILELSGGIPNDLPRPV